MVVNLPHANIGFFIDLAADRVLQALTRLYEAGDGRIAAFGPVGLPTEQAALAIGDENDDCRIGARKQLLVTIGVTASARVAASLWLRRRATLAAEQGRVVPEHECSCMRSQVRLVRRQHGAKEPEVFEFTEVSERRLDLTVDRHGKGGLVAEQPEKDDVVLVDERIDLRSFEQDGARRIAANEAAITQDRYKARRSARHRFGQPVRVLAALATAVDKRACEDVMVF